MTPTSVLPNSKCHGCLNYERNSGVTGQCAQGLQPFNCGSGESPGNGYTPMEHLSPDLPDDIAVSAHDATRREPDEGSPLVMETQVLGDEAASLVKAIETGLTRDMREQCDFHKQAHGTGPASLSVAQYFGKSLCGCRAIDDATIARHLYSELPNVVKSQCSFKDAVAFVGNVRKSSTCNKTIGKTSSGKKVVGPSPELVKANNEAMRWQLGSVHLRKCEQEGWTPQDHREAASLQIDGLAKALEHGRTDDAAAHQYLAQRHAELA